ncbi:unnamed protein product, partial [Symbiodinium pilosum]
ACKRDAEQSGNIAFFNEQAASAELFRKMLYEYITQCASKGPGCKRDRFDWVTYQQRVYAQKQLTKGHKLKPMCYEKWMKHSQEEEFKSWQEAHSEWQRMEANPEVERDQLGPKQSPLRLHCPAGDYIKKEDISGVANERLAGTKQKNKPGAKDIEALDEQIQAHLPGWDDPRLRIGDYSGKTSSLFLLNGGHAVREKRVEGLKDSRQHRLVTQSQQTPRLPQMLPKKYDEVLNTLNKDRKMWESTLQTANDSIKAFLADNSREDYKHFLALAEVRLNVLSAVLEKNITREDLQERLAKLTDEEKTYLPCNIDLFVRPLDMVDKIKAILVAVSKEDLATRKEA